jgi:YD repeat-containing protein
MTLLGDRPTRADLFLLFVCSLTLLVALPATAQSYPSGCRAQDGPHVQGPRFDGSDVPHVPGTGGDTCGGPVSSPSNVYLFSGEFFHHAVDLRIRGRGIDFVWARTYRSQTGPSVGLGAGWDHSYNLKLGQTTAGPSEARQLLFDSDTFMHWLPPADPGGSPADLRYCTLRSVDPADFAGPATDILDPEEPDTGTIDTDTPAPGRLFAYLILPKNGNRAGSLGTDSPAGDPRVGVDCGITGPDLILHDGTGRQDTYTLQANGRWTSPGFFREITENPDGSYTLTFPDTGIWHFLPLDGSPTAGRVDRLADRNQNALSFDYDAVGRLVQVVDTLGRPITVGWDPATGFLESVTDFTGRQVRYEYYAVGAAGGSFDDLRSVTSPSVVGTPNGNDFPLGKTTVYTYSTGQPDPVLNHNLLTITDPRGNVFLTNRYSMSLVPGTPDYDGVISQTWGDAGDRIDYHYQSVTPDPANRFAVRLAIENDRVGNVPTRRSSSRAGTTTPTIRSSARCARTSTRSSSSTTRPIPSAARKETGSSTAGCPGRSAATSRRSASSSSTTTVPPGRTSSRDTPTAAATTRFTPTMPPATACARCIACRRSSRTSSTTGSAS